MDGDSVIGRHRQEPHDAGSGDPPGPEDTRPGTPQVGRPDLDARGLPVQDRVPAGRTYLLALASAACGIASMVVALADGAANGKLAGYQTGLGILSGCVAMGLAPFAVVKQVRQGEGHIGVSGWIALDDLFQGVPPEMRRGHP